MLDKTDQKNNCRHTAENKEVQGRVQKRETEWEPQRERSMGKDVSEWIASALAFPHPHTPTPGSAILCPWRSSCLKEAVEHDPCWEWTLSVTLLTPVHIYQICQRACRKAKEQVLLLVSSHKEPCHSVLTKECPLDSLVWQRCDRQVLCWI